MNFESLATNIFFIQTIQKWVVFFYGTATPDAKATKIH